MMTTVKLSSLGFGGEIDSRSDKETDIASLAHSIEHMGLILPLAVVKNGKGYKVIDGNRRLRALLQLYSDKKTNPEIPVNVLDSDPIFAREQSLAANIERLPLHPMEQYEALSRIAAAGESIGAIAVRFDLSERAVRQRLALGGLAEPIRQAYRNGQITDVVIQRMTRLDEDTQVRLFTGASNKWHLEQLVDKALESNNVHPLSAVAQFVSRETYIAAGGGTAADLFVTEGEEEWTDAALVTKLALEKTAEIGAAILAEGWSFFEAIEGWVNENYIINHPAGVATIVDDGIEEYNQLTGRLEEIEREVAEQDGEVSPANEEEMNDIEARLEELQPGPQWTDEQKATMGVVLDHNYRLYYGAQLREGARPPKAAEPGGEQGEEAEVVAEKPLSNAILIDMDDALTYGMAKVVAREHGMAIRMLALQLIRGSFAFKMDPMYVLAVRVDGQLATPLEADPVVKLMAGVRKAKTFESQMKALWKLEDSHIHEVLAWFVANGLRRHHRGAELTYYLDRLGKLETRKHWTPDAENFFGRLSKVQLQQILRDEGFDDDIGPMKKADAVKFVMGKMPADWLPDAMKPQKVTKS